MKQAPTTRNPWRLAAGTLPLLAAALLPVSARAGYTATFAHESQGAINGNGDFDVSFRSLVANGDGFIFFTREALASTDTDTAQDVYLRLNGVTTHVSQSAVNGNGNFAATFLRTTADGSRVFFSTQESLASTDTDASTDIYLRDNGVTTHISQGAINGNGAMGVSIGDISADGSRVYFVSSEPLAISDTDTSFPDVYLRSNGVTTHVSVSETGANGPSNVTYRQASADGKRVFFTTADRLASTDTDAVIDTYMHEDGVTTHISQGAINGNGNPTAVPVTNGISADGSRVYFSTTEQLAITDTDTASDLYLRENGVTTHISQGAINGNGDSIPNSASFAGSSADGSRVFFTSNEPLAITDTDTTNDTYLRENGVTIHISQGEINGNSNSGFVSYEGISSDGSRVFFTTSEALASTDTDTTIDLYQRENGVTTHISQGAINGNQSTGAVSYRGISADGSRVFFTTTEPLTSADTDTVTDIYMRENGVTTLITPGTAAAVTYSGVSDDGGTILFSTAEALAVTDTDAQVDLYSATLSIAPVLSAVSASSTLSGDAVSNVLKGTSDTSGTGYYIAVPQNSAAPNATQVAAAADYAGVSIVASGHAAVVASIESSFTLSGLADATAYDLYLVVKSSGDVFSAVSKVGLTTLSGMVDGACGSAISSVSVIAPSNNLCASGSATAVSSSQGQWAWICQGTGGSTVNANCNAPYATQTITNLSASPDSILVGATSTVMAGSSSGLPPTLSTSSTTCTLGTSSGSSIVTATATGTEAGSCTVIAERAVSADGCTSCYQAAESKTVSITVARADQSISALMASPASLLIGQTSTVSAIASSELAVSFSTSPGSVCSNVGATVSAVGAGTCTVTATQAGNTAYNAALPQSITISVSAPAVNGVCGTANTTQPTATMPSGGALCAAGVASQVTGSNGTWTWSCNGTNGGTSDTQCAAPYGTQSLSISATPTQVAVGQTSSISASSSSALAVTLTATGGACSLSGSTAPATATVVQAGACSITASQPGTGDTGSTRYIAAEPVSATLTVTTAVESACEAYRSRPGVNVIDLSNSPGGQTARGVNGKFNVIFGSNFADTLTGGNAGNCIDGGIGNDRLTAGSGENHLYGGDGSDTLTPGTGSTAMDGGAGSDRCIKASSRATATYASCESN